MALDAANHASPFHRVTGFEVAQAGEGTAEIHFASARELLNHAAALHAGVQCAALDTVCGYAAATLAGPVVTLQMTTQFLSSAKGERFIARGSVVKAGKSQLFAEAQLFAVTEEAERLVATAAAVLTRVG
ncbi:PaaI family thioesterase [Sphingomonas sp. BN140010]|uniref:PaaI family thioesterase n=1 Tax=Sphingomonas arvum TaxID=2992113 RepID=A0ABT3JHK0_9SPHN|nr:PaaI family thioesterase [Sphingomonas sp. BN140010]MCW3798557.1 PaaI family thioesterase [Sphingomonas sp. BN140010]